MGIFLIVQTCVYGLLGVTNLLFTRKRLSYVFGPEYEITALDIFWQRDIGIFQLGCSVLSLSAYLSGGTAVRVTFIALGFVWTLGAIFLVSTGLLNQKLTHITSLKASIGISFVSAVFGGFNWFFLVRSWYL